jgi:hypothetical protein
MKEKAGAAMPTKARKALFPFTLTPEVTASGVPDLVREILAESERQVEEKKLQDEEAVEDFRMACDALNVWRMRMRMAEEMGGELDKKTGLIFKEMWKEIAKRREYTEDDFRSALEATSERARLPWGFTSLRLAYARTQRNPIRLLKGLLKNAPLPTTIAGIAYELSVIQGPSEPLLLPVDNLRSMLEARKLVVGGAITRLAEAGIITQTSKRYGTGRAREFKFTAEEGTDYEFVISPAQDAE